MLAEAPPTAVPQPARPTRRGRGLGLGLGLAVTYLSLVVLIPLSAVVWRARSDGFGSFWDDVTAPQAVAALKLTVVSGVLVAIINTLMGTLIAWVLVRDHFRGKRVIDTMIDLPFALPTIVAGLVLLGLYGPQSPIGIDLSYKRAGVLVALLFVTLPFVVRAVQPVLVELDRDMEQAAASLGAANITIFRRIVLPNLYPAIAAGAGLAFARS